MNPKVNVGDTVRFNHHGQIVRGVVKRAKWGLFYRKFLIEYPVQEDFGWPASNDIGWFGEGKIFEVIGKKSKENE